MPSGDGSPAGVVTPSSIGELYVDSTNGALFIAAGLTDADWYQVGGNNPGGLLETPGLVVFGGFGSSEVVGAQQSAVTDVNGSNDSGNGIYWNPNRGADGEQTAKVFTGPGGAFSTVLADAAGVMKPATGFDASNLPTVDPAVAGQVWNDAGTLKVSAG